MRGILICRWTLAVAGLTAFIACASVSSGARQPEESAQPHASLVADPSNQILWVPRKPMIPPRVAMLAGLMPLRTLGVDTFRWNYPEFDGRGVLIAILDNGLEPNVPGLLYTTTGEPKILDLRDFSGEGRIELEQLGGSDGDSTVLGGRTIVGLRRVRQQTRQPVYGGLFKERALGSLVSADVNGNGEKTDEYPVFVARLNDGWATITDTDNDGSLADEAFVRDYAVARETFSYLSSPGATGPSPLSLAVNLTQDEGRPVLDFYFDNSGHGTHVAGIAAGHDLFDVAGFDGVAPGAQLLGLKIADNSRGGITVGGSVLRAMSFAVEFANEHDLALVMNMSHGIGNEQEGAALIDSVINEFTYANPSVLFVVSAGNQGPGLSSVGFPGSAQHALSVCGLYPNVFAHGSGPRAVESSDVVAAWSARGGEVAKPDLCAPGKAYSVVPPWLAGKEILEGTSQAAPQIAGVAARLLSANRATNGGFRAVDIARALKNTATLPNGVTELDAGAGVPDVGAAFDWLRAGHQAGLYDVVALNDAEDARRGSASFRRSGFASASDSVQRFVVQSIGGQPAARLLLRPNVDWISAPARVEPRGGPMTIELEYDQSKLRIPGLYVGSVFALSATDTAAGPMFELLNTVVVPHGLSPNGYKQKLKAGSVHRHFFQVPDGAGGLEVVLGLADPSSSATLFLFEPDGRPFRGREKLTVGSHRNSEVAIMASADELIPGVYEAVVLAPPANEIAFWLEVAVPDVVVESVGDGAIATVRNSGANTVRAVVSASLIGAEQRHVVSGTGSRPESIRLTPPEWAELMQLEVEVPSDVWNMITGFGVTLSDSTGVRVSHGPLIYSGAKQVVDLEQLEHSGDLDVELLPAYAREGDRSEWTAAVDVQYFFSDPQTLTLADGNERAGLVLGPSATRRVDFELAGAWQIDRAELLPIVEVVAQLPAGPRSVRRGAVLPEKANER